MHKRSTLLLVYLCAACNLINGQPVAVAKIPPPKHSFTVIAHRGDHTAVPENTLAAFEEGIRNGVDYVEVDLRTTKDSVLVIMHDATVDRMTNGKGKISDLNYAVLKQFRITDKKKDSLKEYTMPLFEEVLSLCRNKVYIYLDFKDADVEQAYSLVKKYGMEQQVIVYINAHHQLDEWKRVAPEIPLMISLPDNIKTTQALKDFLAKTPVSLLDGDYSDYTPDMVTLAVAEGLVVWPDIQGAKEDINWDKALQTGFNGLQTDHPAALISWLKKRGVR